MRPFLEVNRTQRWEAREQRSNLGRSERVISRSSRTVYIELFPLTWIWSVFDSEQGLSSSSVQEENWELSSATSHAAACLAAHRSLKTTTDYTSLWSSTVSGHQAVPMSRDTGQFSLSGEIKWGREANLHFNPTWHLYVSIITNKAGADVEFPDRKWLHAGSGSLQWKMRNTNKSFLSADLWYHPRACKSGRSLNIQSQCLVRGAIWSARVPGQSECGYRGGVCRERPGWQDRLLKN